MDEKKTWKKSADNWWHYHRLWLIAGAVGLLLFIHMIWSSFNSPGYDLQVAVITREAWPDPVLDQLSQGLSLYAEDLDGDGSAAVRVVQYVINFRPDERESIDQRTQAAGVSGMLADLKGCYSQVFLVEDPDGFSASTGALRYRDGELPEDDVYPSWQETCYRWTDCPSLTALTFPGYDAGLYGGSGRTEDWFRRLYIGSRGFWDGTAPEYPEASEAFWQALTAGAAS